MNCLLSFLYVHLNSWRQTKVVKIIDIWLVVLWYNFLWKVIEELYWRSWDNLLRPSIPKGWVKSVLFRKMNKNMCEVRTLFLRSTDDFSCQFPSIGDKLYLTTSWGRSSSFVELCRAQIHLFSTVIPTSNGQREKTVLFFIGRQWIQSWEMTDLHSGSKISCSCSGLPQVQSFSHMSWGGTILGSHEDPHSSVLITL